VTLRRAAIEIGAEGLLSPWPPALVLQSSLVDYSTEHHFLDNRRQRYDLCFNFVTLGTSSAAELKAFANV
jgi:hypothetical protein